MNLLGSLYHRIGQSIKVRASGSFFRAKGLRLPLSLEILEERNLLSATFYTPDGTGNNVANPSWGSAGTDLLRISPAAYSDGISSPALAGNPSARVISDLLNNQADPSNPEQNLNTVDQQNLSDFGYAWGQFLDHDMSLTPTNPAETLQILADPNDPSQMGNQTFDRSVYDPTTGTSMSNPRQQITAVTAYLDLSQVYGSSAALADALRTHLGGQLKTSPGNMLPYDNSTYFTPAQLAIINMANDAQAVPTQDLFVTGDVRGNENVELTALQTLFVRNHNRIATELAQEHPTWSDEQLYQEARKLNIADYQQITYTYYLPDLLGAGALPQYTGYNPNVDPAIATEFSTVAFRFGHSLLSGGIERAGNNGLDVLPNDPAGAGINLATDFFDPNVLNPAGVVDPLTGHTSTDIGPILKGDADGTAQADDLLAINEIRNLLFANGGLQDNGQDLIARDVERARDNGIGSYNQVRQAYGLPAVTSFAQITSNATVQQELQAVYGTVDNIDPFEGGMAEDHVAGSDMGPLFTRIIADQFTRLRDGDRFFYLNQTFNQDELHILGQGNTLGKVIKDNTNITNLQSDVFVFKASIGGTVVEDPHAVGQPGYTVQLKDDNGNVLATTTTDSSGHYSFNQQTGIGGTGNYTIALLLPSGMTQVSANPSTITISRGDVNVSGVSFKVAPAATHFEVVVPQTVTAGSSFEVVVVALNASNHQATSYRGTVQFTLGAADAGALLPADYTFTAQDAGRHAFHVTLTASGSQMILVTDTGTNTIAGSAVTTVNAGGVAPTITLNPSSQTVAVGSTVTLTASASGSPTPTVQWQVSTGGAFVNIPGATSTTYSFTVAAGQNGNQYRAVFTNSAGQATTTTATLTTTTGIVVGAGQQLEVSAGQTVTGVTVLPGGDLIVDAGGTDKGSLIDGGDETVEAGGQSIGTTIDGEGDIEIFGSGSGLILDEGYINVDQGGTVTGTVINGDIMYVSGGGTAINTTIYAGGSTTVIGGGVANGTILDGGEEFVRSGAVTNGTTVNNGGTEYVFAGGVSNNLTVNNGGNATMLGTVNGAAINNGGTVTVFDGGSATGAIVDNGMLAFSLSGTNTFAGQLTGNGALSVQGTGKLVVSSVLNNNMAVTIGNSSSLELGGAANANITFGYQSTLKLDVSQAFTGTITATAGYEDVLDLGDVPFVLGVMTVQYVENAAHTQGVLTVSDQADGGPTVQLTLLGDFSVGTFSIATDSVASAQNPHPGTLINGPF